jgi:hypothetical protein
MAAAGRGGMDDEVGVAEEEEEGRDNIVDSWGQRAIRLKANGSDQSGLLWRNIV